MTTTETVSALRSSMNSLRLRLLAVCLLAAGGGAALVGVLLMDQAALYGVLHQPTGEMRVLELLFTPVVPGVAFRERFARAATERELRMIALKREVNALARRCGQQAPYDVSFADEPAAGKTP